VIRPSIRLRLTLTYSALFVTAGAAMLAINYFLVAQREHKSGTAVGIVCQAKILGSGPAEITLPTTLAPNVAKVPNGCARVTLKSGSGQISGSSTFRATLPPNVAVDQTGQQLAQKAQLVVRGQDHTLHSLEVESAITLGIMAIASLGLGWLIAGRALRPVHRITDTARRLSEETLDERIALDGPDDELKELADTFDAMLGRLHRAFESQRRFVANASHELRTPLATDRVLIDEALVNRGASPDDLRVILTDLRANNEEMARLIDALLVLARSDQGVRHPIAVDLRAVAQQVIEQNRPEAVASGVELRSDLQDGEVSGDPALLTRLIGNLVENGIRHNLPEGGWVQVDLQPAGNQVRLHVSNSGRVLDQAHVPNLFEPFRRESADRTVTDRGFGLGLSIVHSVVDAHGGHLVADARRDGGLDVTVMLRGAVEAATPGDAAAGRQYSADRGAVAG